MADHLFRDLDCLFDSLLFAQFWIDINGLAFALLNKKINIIKRRNCFVILIIKLS
tara:strand:- start:782 stop:946 length:165 start_codon:yes stop_codon:yes gene_type:complete